MGEGDEEAWDAYQAYEQDPDGWWEYGMWHTAAREGLLNLEEPDVNITMARPTNGPVQLPDGKIQVMTPIGMLVYEPPRTPYEPVIDPHPTPAPSYAGPEEPIGVFGPGNPLQSGGAKPKSQAKKLPLAAESFQPPEWWLSPHWR